MSSSRLKYRLLFVSVGQHYNTVWLLPPKAMPAEAEPNQQHRPEIGPALAAFLFFHGTCRFCGAPIDRELAACSCGCIRPKQHLAVAVGKEHAEQLDAIVKRLRINGYKRNRTIRKRRGGGSHKDHDIVDLLRVQSGRCYYCACEFAQEREAPLFHVDHYISLLNGGGDGVENLVLACPACNMCKGDADGDWFERQIKPSTKNKLEHVILSIRMARQEYLASRRLISSSKDARSLDTSTDRT